METLPATITPYMELLRGPRRSRALRNVSPAMSLTFHFENDDDAKSAAIIMRNLARALRLAADQPWNWQAVLYARLEMARAQQRLNAGVQYKMPERRQSERRVSYTRSL